MNVTISILVGNILSTLRRVKLFGLRTSTPLPCLDCFLIIPTSFFLRLGEFMINLMIPPGTSPFAAVHLILKRLFASLCFDLPLLKAFSLQTHCPTPSQGQQAVLVVATSQGDILLPRNAESVPPPQPRLSYEAIHSSWHGLGAHHVTDTVCCISPAFKPNDNPIM